jgi:transposase
MVAGTLNIAQRYQIAQEVPIVVSLDMHDTSTYALGVNVLTGEICIDHNILGTPETVLRAIEKLKIRDRCEILYEAGNHGFHPYRLFTKAGYLCRIIAPSSLPENRKKRVEKTDRNDCVRNLDYHLGGLMTYVTVPDVKAEAIREILRYRYSTVYKTTKQKQKIISFTKRHGLSYTLTKRNWTVTYRKWIKNIEVDVRLRCLLDIMIDELNAEEERLKRVDLNLDLEFKQDEQLSRKKRLYELLPGFGRVNSMTMVLEGGELSRFGHPKAMMKFTGLIPGKHQSSTSDPVLGITKGGNGFLRIALVSAAKIYRDPRAQYPRAAIEKYEEPLKEFLSRMQTRMFNRYRALRENKKHANKIRCAIARELCGFLWELMVKIEPMLQKEKYLKAA